MVVFSSQGYCKVPSWVLTRVAGNDKGGQGPRAGYGEGSEGTLGLAGGIGSFSLQGTSCLKQCHQGQSLHMHHSGASYYGTFYFVLPAFLSQIACLVL